MVLMLVFGFKFHMPIFVTFLSHFKRLDINTVCVINKNRLFRKGFVISMLTRAIYTPCFGNAPLDVEIIIVTCHKNAIMLRCNHQIPFQRGMEVSLFLSQLRGD